MPRGATHHLLLLHYLRAPWLLHKRSIPACIYPIHGPFSASISNVCICFLGAHITEDFYDAMPISFYLFVVRLDTTLAMAFHSRGLTWMEATGLHLYISWTSRGIESGAWSLPGGPVSLCGTLDGVDCRTKASGMGWYARLSYNRRGFPRCEWRPKVTASSMNEKGQYFILLCV